MTSFASHRGEDYPHPIDGTTDPSTRRPMSAGHVHLREAKKSLIVEKHNGEEIPILEDGTDKGMPDNTSNTGVDVGTNMNTNNLANNPYHNLSDNDGDNSDDDNNGDDDKIKLVTNPSPASAELIIDIDKEITGVADAESACMADENNSESTGVAMLEDEESTGVPLDNDMADIDTEISKVAATIDQELKEIAKETPVDHSDSEES